MSWYPQYSRKALAHPALNTKKYIWENPISSWFLVYLGVSWSLFLHTLFLTGPNKYTVIRPTGQHGHLKRFYISCASRVPSTQLSRWYGIWPRGQNKVDSCRQKGTSICSQNIFCSQKDQNKHRWLVEHRAVRMTSCWYEFVVNPVKQEVG